MFIIIVEVGGTVAGKRRAFEELLQRRDRLPVTDTGHRVGCETGGKICKKNGGLVMGRATGE